MFEMIRRFFRWLWTPFRGSPDLPQAVRARSVQAEWAPEGIAVGSPVWWHGRAFSVYELRPEGKDLVRFRGHGYQVTCVLSEMRWDPMIEHFVLPGTEDIRPKKVRGEWSFPDGPVCPGCGFRTLRPVLCYLCKDRAALTAAKGSMSAQDFQRAEQEINHKHQLRREKLAAEED